MARSPLLWLLDGDQRLGPEARRAVEAADVLAVSVASLWEISIKISIGRLGPLDGLLPAVRDLGFERLDIRDEHLTALQALPLRHRDPFDRLLIAQALTGGLTVLTSDDVFTGYGIPVIDARR